MAINAIRNIKAFFPSTCHRCGAAIVKGDRCWVNRAAARGQRISCVACGEPARVDMPSKVPVVASLGMTGPVNETAAVMPMVVQPMVPMAASGHLPDLPGGDGVYDAPVGRGGDLASVIAAAVQGHLNLGGGAVNEQEVRRTVSDLLPGALSKAAADGVMCDRQTVEEIVAAALNAGSLQEMVERMVAGVVKAGIRRVEVVIPDRPVVDATGQHESYPVLVQLLAARCHVWLVGAAGSGKTTAVENAALSLGLPFYCLSVGEQTSVYQLLGHRTPDGAYVRSMFREAYEHGGVFLLDEIDAGNPNVLTTINSALSNGSCAFPDGMVKRHADFLCAAAGNTYGRGANRVYVGRAQIDGATLDRFVFLAWDYDEKLEASFGSDSRWLEFVQACRAVAERLAIWHVISPRAVIYGSRLLAAGMDRAAVETMVLWKGLDADSVKRIKDGVRS